MKPNAITHSHDASREPKPALQAADNSRYQHLIDGLPGMAYLARADHARTVEFASAGCHGLLGLKPNHKAIHLTSLIHPEERDQVLEIIHSAIENDHPFAVEYRIRHANGQWRTVWEQGRPIRLGQDIAVQGHLMDVTQRIQREQARLAAELRLLQAQKFHALNQLAGGVAHEFNNLIAGILGSAELVAMDMPEGHPGHDTLKQIFEASNHAREFVHRLRMLGQRPVPEFKLVRMQSVIEETLQILRTIIPAKAELEARISPDCPKVTADSAQLHQAILDLCLYAWQGLAERRGRITIVLENCPVVRLPAGTPNLLQPGPHIHLMIQDNSPGLDKNTRDHIFHPFRTRRAGGKKIGLELFLVRETIQTHQGEIFLETEPGRGLEFHIYLPVASEQ